MGGESSCISPTVSAWRVCCNIELRSLAHQLRALAGWVIMLPVIKVDVITWIKADPCLGVQPFLETVMLLADGMALSHRLVTFTWLVYLQSSMPRV